jgi:hypothetical protein
LFRDLENSFIQPEEFTDELLAIGIVSGNKYLKDRIKAMKKTWLTLAKHYQIYGDQGTVNFFCVFNFLTVYLVFFSLYEKVS